ncbi:unnamed protein product [Brachionus calyciflorus]|uniref:R3H domain-containing protein n=1 Tax=Brachionus calyciflorus TaxID=104777 RepID=A0A814GXL1_9BILA|nr:unnamed protein product [Brachionus calyciflorus]
MISLSFSESKDLFEVDDDDENINFILPDGNIEDFESIDEAKFKTAVSIIVGQIVNGENQTYKFLSNLNSDQRQFIHKLCDENKQNHVTIGTRYKVLTIFGENKKIAEKRMIY